MMLAFKTVEQLQYVNPEGTKIDCLVQFEGHDEKFPFTAYQDDIEPHSVEIFFLAANEAFGPVAPYEAPPAKIPRSITPAQAKITLFEAGLLDDVEALVATHPYRPVSIWWANASQFERGNPYLNGIGMELNLTDDQIDRMFTDAAKK